MKQLPKVRCWSCSHTVQLSNELEVFILRYRHSPWFDNVAWCCPGCGSYECNFLQSYSDKVAKKLIKKLMAKGVQVLTLATANKYQAKAYKKTFGIKMPIPKEPQIDSLVKNFGGQLHELQNVAHFKALT